MRRSHAVVAALAAVLAAPAATPAHAASETVILLSLDYTVDCPPLASALRCLATFTDRGCDEGGGSWPDCTVEEFTLPLAGVNGTNACAVLLPDDTRPAEPLVVHTSTAGELTLDVTFATAEKVAALAGTSRPGGLGVATVALAGLRSGSLFETCPAGPGVVQGVLAFVAP